MTHWFKYVLLFCLIATLASCGFKLRGSMPLAPPLHKLYLQTNKPFGPLSQHLRQALRASQVELVDSSKEANTILNIQNETTGEQLLSVGGTQQTRQYNLLLIVNFEVTEPSGRVLVPTQTVTESRTLTQQSSRILGSSNEANALFDEMRQAIVFDIMNRLASQTTREALTKNSQPS